ncbi:hypothetical protein CEXT_106811 [Caerostris extrusa]|uniref:Uncharacterized protein n=1 Tax=Caerostris extrusa TaxID=172846 RepID=A0AAV4SME2_CAEEX|nr:hypothetical protein CEXT_106811 [Caerostris extrusa]
MYRTTRSVPFRVLLSVERFECWLFHSYWIPSSSGQSVKITRLASLSRNPVSSYKKKCIPFQLHPENSCNLLIRGPVVTGEEEDSYAEGLVLATWKVDVDSRFPHSSMSCS